ncbi:MAG: hypothetical protein MZU97_03465 [Bacillus subtilis]|nr:hypothetical protein [Bacillus subtilis]
MASPAKSTAASALNSVYLRDSDYFAPVSAHFGYNNVAQYAGDPRPSSRSRSADDSFSDRSKIQYIDELDPDRQRSNAARRKQERYRATSLIKPGSPMAFRRRRRRRPHLADGCPLHAEAAAKEIGARMNLADVEVIHREILHPAEATRIQIKGRVDFDIDMTNAYHPRRRQSRLATMRFARLSKPMG